MGNESNVNGRWVYSKLRVCGHLVVLVRVYDDWIKTNSHLVGFLCEVTGEKTEEKLAKISDFITRHELPLVLEDMPGHGKQFKLKITRIGL